MSVVVFHNPACGTSRSTLELIRAHGIDPTVIEYLKTGWTAPLLQALCAAMGARPRDVLREKEALVNELGLLSLEVSDAQMIEAMIAHPILVNRPIVVSAKGVRLTRPAERVKELL